MSGAENTKAQGKLSHCPSFTQLTTEPRFTHILKQVTGMPSRLLAPFSTALTLTNNTVCNSVQSKAILFPLAAGFQEQASRMNGARLLGRWWSGQCRKTSSLRLSSCWYTNMMNRAGGIGSQTQQGFETRIKAHTESKERDLSTKGGSKQYFLPDPCIDSLRESGDSHLHTHGDYWWPQGLMEKHAK